MLLLAALAALAVTPLASARSDEGSTRISIVVGFEDAASAARQAAALAGTGVRVDDRLPKLDALVVSAPAGAVTEALAELRTDGVVAYAAREAYRTPLLVPNDPGYTTSTWPYLQTALPNAWDVTTGQSSVVIAVIDSGIDFAHPDLPALAAGYDFVNDDADPADDHGHGTAVTGAVAARINNGVGAAGACSGCTVMPIKVLDGPTGLASDTDIVAGIVWATDHGADVLNISLGGDELTQVLVDAVAYARSRGVVVIAAGGNDGTEGIQYPAGVTGVLGVAGSDPNDALYAFSNRGQHLDLAAPGCFQTTTMGGGSGEACGTSIAAPIVAGIAGLVLSRQPSLVGTQVESALLDTANGLLGLNVEHGLVDANAALVVAAAMTLVPANTAAPQVSGTAEAGQTLTATTGTWTGSPTSYAYAWERCNASGAACGPVTGATSSTYALSNGDVGATFRVAVTATNGGGTASRASATTAVVAGSPAVPGLGVDVWTTLGVSAAEATVGSTLVYRSLVGARSGSSSAEKVSLAVTLPTGLDSVGVTTSRGTCSVKGQTVTCALGYLAYPLEAEVLVTAKPRLSRTLTVLALATTTPEDAQPTDNRVTQSVKVASPDGGPPSQAPTAPPANQGQSGKTPVTIGGAAKIGSRLTARPGSSWAGKAPHRFRYQWQSCSTVKGKLRCTNLSGKTARTLAVGRAYLGKRLRVLAIALAADGTSERRHSRLTGAIRS